MNLYALNRAIREMCAEVKEVSPPGPNWRMHNEEELLFEAVLCIFSSQLVFEMATACAKRIRNCGLLVTGYLGLSATDYEERIASALSMPVTVRTAGKVRTVMPRFKNRLASLLATTVAEIYGRGTSLLEILDAAASSREAREALIEKVWGFGPKQASLFLRRIGYCNELAVLDVHILDYLKIARGLFPKASILSRLVGYERIEREFQSVATEFGYPVGCVDLATWVTMRVAKRESLL